jgi:hypothetical protein
MTNKKAPAPTGACEGLANPILQAGTGFREWRDQVSRLQSLGQPLLAVGTDKAPIHLVTGKHLSGWQEADFTAEQIAGSKAAIGCGVRTGNGLLAFDVDGLTALAWLLDHGCDPREAKTWQIHRDTDPNRFKVAFTLTAEQQQQFGNAKPKQKTKDAAKDDAGNVIKGEAVEVFHSTGGQVVVLGQHHDSGGNYYWPDGLVVEDLAPIPECWWQAALTIANGTASAKVSTTKASSSSREWKPLNPCLICGRNTTSYCSQHRDGKTIRCFHGNTFAPPKGLKPGDRHTDSNGQQWGFSQEQVSSTGDLFSVFVKHDENSKAAKAFPSHPASKQETPPKPVTFEDRWQELEEHAGVVACSDWSVMKAVASLASKAGDLEVNRLTGRNFEQLLEQAHRAVRAKADPIAGGGSFKVKTTPWAVDGLFRHGLNLLVGQSGAGKSRLAAACMAAWLRGDQTWLNLPLNGIEAISRYALIVGSDQTLEDWAITLEPVGLCKRLDAETVQVHPKLTLYGLETAVGLDADGLAIIRRWVDHHPGGMVLIDSLSSCLPPGIDEATKAAGRPVRQLQEVLGDAWGILTHHTRKGAGKEGNLGVGAGRGSGDIDAAASRVIGLGLIHKMESGVLVPQESDDRRELLSTKRGGKTLHLVVRSDASGFWSNEGDAEVLKQQERQERALSNLTEAQGDVLALLEVADGWMTLRGLIEGAGEEYDAKGAKAASTRKVLKRLEVLGLVESVKSGIERTYRTKGEPPRVEERELTGSLGSPTAPQGFSLAHPLAHPGSASSSEPVTGNEPSEQLATASEPTGEPAKRQSHQQVSQVSHLHIHEYQAPRSEQRQENEQRIRELGRSNDLSGWSDDEVADLVQSLEQAARRQAGSGLLGQEVA